MNKLLDPVRKIRCGQVAIPLFTCRKSLFKPKTIHLLAPYLDFSQMYICGCITLNLERCLTKTLHEISIPIKKIEFIRVSNFMVSNQSYNGLYCFK